MLASDRRFAAALLLGAASCALIVPVGAHMTMWHKSMYGVGPGFTNLAGDPFSPIGPDIASQNDWWFRGPEYRALKPQNATVMELPVGTSVDVELACNVAWTSYGERTTDNNAELSACPENYGAYHSGDPAGPVDESMLSGCALAVADKDDIEQVGWDDLVVFSVNHDCVKQRITPFEIPSRMPACSGEKCICAWFWLANNGTGNFYMTGFDCKFTGVDPKKALPLLPPVDPVFCAPGNDSAYNQPTNVVWQGNNDRPGYHASWSFPKNGAQEDIFDTSSLSSPKESTSTLSTQSKQISEPISSTCVYKPLKKFRICEHELAAGRNVTADVLCAHKRPETIYSKSYTLAQYYDPRQIPVTNIYFDRSFVVISSGHERTQRKRPQNLGGILSEMRALQRLMLPSLTERSAERRTWPAAAWYLCHTL
ncbi:hypothetical protein B0A53_05441 [Rhodotorula sp. CCFEE 5036]|nr:hypothetical protein B0A53_05441 [Rhodotorula sp. CCFEE 5036]